MTNDVQPIYGVTDEQTELLTENMATATAVMSQAIASIATSGQIANAGVITLISDTVVEYDTMMREAAFDIISFAQSHQNISTEQLESGRFNEATQTIIKVHGFILLNRVYDVSLQGIQITPEQFGNELLAPIMLKLSAVLYGESAPVQQVVGPVGVAPV